MATTERNREAKAQTCCFKKADLSKDRMPSFLMDDILSHDAKDAPSHMLLILLCSVFLAFLVSCIFSAFLSLPSLPVALVLIFVVL